MMKTTINCGIVDFDNACRNYEGIYFLQPKLSTNCLPKTVEYWQGGKLKVFPLFEVSEVDFKTSITHVVGTSGDMSKPMLVRKILIFFGTTQHCLISNFLGHLQDYSYHHYHLTLTSILGYMLC